MLPAKSVTGISTPDKEKIGLIRNVFNYFKQLEEGGGWPWFVLSGMTYITVELIAFAVIFGLVALAFWTATQIFG